MRLKDGHRCELDVSQLTPRLYQGSRPRPGPEVHDCGFDVLILTAQEWQPPSRYFPGVEVIHAPFDDAAREPTDQEWQIARRAAQLAERRIARGKRVLTTCQMGLNRSGLVNALTMYLLTGMRGEKIVRHIRMCRQGALFNPYFVRAVERLRGK